MFGSAPLVRDGMTEVMMEEDAADAPADAHRAGPAARHARRLSDKILIAFHQACDQGDHEVAHELIRVVELMLMRRPVRPDANRRKNMESLVAAHERLWLLRHPGAG